MSISLEITTFLQDFNPTSATKEQVEKLEDYVEQANEAYQSDLGVLEVADSIYDKMLKVLKEANPESKYVKEIWEIASDDNLTIPEELKVLMEKTPMRSILTCKSVDTEEFASFRTSFISLLSSKGLDEVTCHLSMKLNGWGVRTVWQNGHFVSATSRARSVTSRGKDLTKAMTVILAKNNLTFIEELENVELAEIRGEVVLPFHNLEQARLYNANIVNAFSGVSSMIKESASDEEHACLDFIPYSILMEDYEAETKEEEYVFLEELGFEVPKYMMLTLTADDLGETLQEIVDEISEEVFTEDEESSYPYFTDGTVLQINNNELFTSMGSDNKYNYGNVALKIGRWSQEGYFGYLQYIEFTKGKNLLIPVAIISESPEDAIFNYQDDLYYSYTSLVEENGEVDEPIEKLVTNYKDLGVPTVSGSKVRRVPLYNPSNILTLGLKEGSIIHFKYGGEAGVVPCKEDGSNIKDDLTDSLEERYFAEDYSYGGKWTDDRGIDWAE